MNALWLEKPTSTEAPFIGGKARELVRLRTLGYRVPDFVVFTTLFFEEFASTRQLNETAVTQVLAWMRGHGDSFAVRSSSNFEDGHLQSYAGVFETVLGVKPDNFRSSLETVLNSARAAREKGYSSAPPKMAVVVQKMIQPLVAGVAFSRNPAGDSSVLRIEACEGLGTGVVDGSGLTETLLKLRLTDLVQREGPPLLSPEAVSEIESTLLKIEKDFGHPVDLEWAWTGQELHVLQARPITQSFGPLQILSDANLSESYPGFTAPLSCDFVRRMYQSVFTDSARLLGARPEQIQELTPFYEGLVQDVEGHLYYNLENYAAAMGALPNGERQFQRWLELIGFSEKVDVPVPHLKTSTFSSKARTLLTLLRLSWSQTKLTQDFLKRSSRRLTQLHDEFLSLKKTNAPAQIVFDRIERELSAPQDLALGIFNDYFLMGHSANKQLGASTNLQLESVRPQLELAYLARHFTTPLERAKLQELLRDETLGEDQFFSRLAAQFSNSVCQDVESFLLQYGERSFGDLKLENLTLRQDPRSLVLLLLRTEASLQKPPPPVNPSGLSKFEQALVYREHCRLLRTRYFGWFRDLYLLLGASLFPADRTDIFYVRFEDLRAWRQGLRSEAQMQERVLQNKNLAVAWQKRSLPELLVIARGAQSLGMSFDENKNGGDESVLKGEQVSQGKIAGQVLKVRNPNDIPADMNLSGRVLITETTDPAWVYLLSQCQALISERGSALSHVAIIARELKKPLLVKVPKAMSRLNEGEWIEVDASGVILRVSEKTET